MDLTSILHTQPILGVITDTEMLLIEEVSGKRAMRSLLLPLEVNGWSGLLDFLWQTGLSAVWVMPTTALSRGVRMHRLLSGVLAQLHRRRQALGRPISEDRDYWRRHPQ